MDAAEQINVRMRWLLVAQAVGFFAWQAGDGMAHSEQIPVFIGEPAFIASLSGGLLWLIAMLAFFHQAHSAKEKGLQDILNDEWARHVRDQAARAAFWILTVCVVASMTATNFGADGQLLLKVNTGVAVSGFFMAYVWYDSRHEGDI